MTNPSWGRSRTSNVHSVDVAFRGDDDGGIEIVDYPKLLDELWSAARAPRGERALTAISTFSGCGGSLLGYAAAGFRELLAVEWNENAQACLRANFSDLDVAGDITKLSDGEVLERTGLRVGELDLLDGSPPCQGFSTMGNRDMGDSRNQLFRDFVRLLNALRPRAFVMENVSGMVKGSFGLIFSEILEALKSVGYAVRVRLLNASYFGVPQSRERLIFIGIRSDLGINPSHPKGWSRPISMNAALSDLNSIRIGAVHTPLTFGENRATMLAKARLLRVREGFGPIDLVGVRNQQFENKWRSANKPCPTIASARPPIVWLSDGTMRELTGIECARLGSFPDQFVFVGSESEARRRIGNSVPPMFMWSIASHVRDLLSCAPNDLG